jgi:hypothetical protein
MTATERLLAKLPPDRRELVQRHGSRVVADVKSVELRTKFVAEKRKSATDHKREQ